jgi:hypothetical protein
MHNCLKALPEEVSENLVCVTVTQTKQPETKAQTEVEAPLADEKIHLTSSWSGSTFGCRSSDVAFH